MDSDAVMLAAVLFEDLHAGPRDGVAAGQLERIDVAIGARSGLSHDFTEFVVLHDSHGRFGVADVAAIHEKDLLRGEIRSRPPLWPGSASAPSVPPGKRSAGNGEVRATVIGPC